MEVYTFRELTLFSLFIFLAEDLAFADEVPLEPIPQRAPKPHKKKSTAIAPVADANSLSMAGAGISSATPSSATGYMSFQARQQATIEPPRLMLDEEDEEEENDKVEEEVQPPSVNFKQKSVVLKNALTAIRKSKDTETPLESLQDPSSSENNGDEGSDEQGDTEVFEMRQADQNAPDYSEDHQ